MNFHTLIFGQFLQPRRRPSCLAAFGIRRFYSAAPGKKPTVSAATIHRPPTQKLSVSALC